MSLEELMSGDIIIGCRKNQDGYEEEFSFIDALSLDEIDRNYLLIHTGMVDVEDGDVRILDVTLKRGVSSRSLELFRQDFTRQDGTMPVFIVLRSRKNLGKLWIENARRHLGETYSCDFLEHEGSIYCTELLQISCLDENGKDVFTREPMDFLSKDGSMPEFWTHLFSWVNSPVPQGMVGCNPRSIIHSNQLVRTHLSLQ